MPKVKRDGDFILIDVPSKDLQSMGRFIAHQVVIMYLLVKLLAK